MFDLERMEEPQSDEDDPYWLAESDLENEEGFQRSEIALLKIPTSSLERDRAALFSGCRDIASWLSPEQQGHKELEPPSTVFLRDTVPSGRAYARALETIYKGFQSYLILLVKFLNRIPSVEQAFRISCPFIHSPIRPTISTLIYALWERIKLVFEHFIYMDVKSQIQNSDAARFTCTESQTDLSSLKCCAGCRLTQECIRGLISVVESHCKTLNISDTNIERIKHSMKVDIFLLSQWGAISKWCEAISLDLTSICHQDAKTKLLYESIILETEKLKFKHRIQKRTYNDNIRIFKNKLKILRNEFKKEKTKNKTLKNSVSALSAQVAEQSTELTTAKKRTHQYETTINSLRDEIKYLTEGSEKFRVKIQETADLFRNKCEQLDEAHTENQRLRETYSKKIDILSLESKKRDDFLRKCQLKIKAQEDQISKLTREKSLVEEKTQQERLNMVNTEKRFKKLCEVNVELENLVAQKNDEILQLNSKVIKLEQELNNGSKFEIAEDKGSVPAVPHLKVVGDPITDMKAKVRANNSHIKVLNEENIRLQSTLTKILLHKMKNGRMSK